MKKLITFIIFLWLSIGFSQTSKQDSLAIQLAFQKADTLKVNTSILLVKELYQQQNYDKALQYISQTEKLSNTLHYEKGNAEIIYYKALIYAKKNDYINAIENYIKSKELFISLGDTLNVAKVNNSIGLIEIERGNYSKGLMFSLSAIEELKKRNLTSDLCTAYRSLAKAYLSINEYNKAIEYNLKTLNLEQQLNNEAGIISSTLNLANLYSQEKEHRKAIDYFENVLRRIDKDNDTLRSEILPKLGGEYLQFKDFEKATTYLFDGLRLNRKLKNKSGLLISLNNIGYLNLQKKHVKYAEIQLTEARELARELDNKKELLKNYGFMKALDSTTRNFARAFVWQREYYSLKNSMLPKTNLLTNVNTVETKLTDFKTIKPSSDSNKLIEQNLEKDKKIKDLKLFFYGLLAAFAIAITFLILIYSKRNNSIKHVQETENKNISLNIQNKAILEQTKHLEDINQVKDRLFSIVSHDLKDSLSSIKGFIDLLKDGSLSQEEFDNLIPELSENANNASLLLFNLLNWSKSQMQSLEPSPSLFDIHDVFEDKTNLLEQKIESKGIILRNHTLRDFVYADRSMVEIVIQNLLTNAIKFTHPGGTITLSNHVSNGKTILSITDTGVGISKENIEKIFNNTSFTTTGTKNEKGTGLGLTICKELVELNQGKIWVESAINSGTTFYVELPKSNPES